MGYHPYECSSRCSECAADEFADSVRDTVGTLSDDELRDCMADVRNYPVTGLTEQGEAAVAEAVEIELTLRQIDL